MFGEKFPSYTPIQEKAIPIISSGKDTLIIAPPGSGKTEAAFLPILDGIHSAGAMPIALLYITPLRSLNRDMVERLRLWAGKLGIRVSVRHGDTSQAERAFQSRHPAHIFITTPETLQAMLGTKAFRNHLCNLRYVIVDELHELIGSKRGAQLSLALTRLREISDFQAIAISATLASPEAASRFVLKDDWALVEDAGSKRAVIEVMRANGNNEGARLDFICEVISKHLTRHKVLVFTNTRYMAELIGSKLIADKANVGVHHGSLSKEEREAIEDDFKRNKIRGLVCTSSLELGIDIGDVDLVIHIGSPKQVRKCLQRVGRSGHALSGTPRGIVITHNEFDFSEAEAISRRAARAHLDGDEIIYPALDVLGHAVAGELLVKGKSGGLELFESLVKRTPIYSQVAFDEFRLLLSELHRSGVIFYDGTTTRKTLRTREFYFTRLSTIPSTVKYAMDFKGRAIGYLDERFALSLNEGDVFITRGTPWRAVSIEEGKVIVERSPFYTLAIPDWEGEQVPVKMEIAMEARDIMGFAKRPKVAVFADIVIIYSFLGSKANSALALAIASRLTNYFGAEVMAKSSPYAVFIRTPYPLTHQSLLRILTGVNVQNEIFSSLHKNRTFSLIFSQAAYYMGLSDGHERYSPYYISKLASSLVYKEARDYFTFRYCDIPAAQKFIDGALSGGAALDFEILPRLNRLAAEALDHMSGSQVLFPDIPESAAMALLDKLPSTFRFICAHCGNTFYGHVSALPKKCPVCTSVLLSPAPDNENRKLTKAELMRRAALYSSYGKKSLLALSTYGVGTETAARILSRLHKDEHALALDLLRAREQFIRTKKYWSPSGK